jgi:glycosyltransferase involved in cell wall biosynthesis
VPDARLDLVGSNPDEAVLALGSDHVYIHANVSHRELERFYADSHVAVVPLRFGAGVKLKVVEAMSRGVPVVTTPVGAQGLPGLGDVAFIAESAQALADGIVQLLRSPADAARATESGLAYLRTHYSQATMRAALAKAFAGAPAPGGVALPQA